MYAEYSESFQITCGKARRGLSCLSEKCFTNNNKNGGETIKIIIVVFDSFIQLRRIDRYM